MRCRRWRHFASGSRVRVLSRCLCPSNCSPEHVSLAEVVALAARVAGGPNHGLRYIQIPVRFGPDAASSRQASLPYRTAILSLLVPGDRSAVSALPVARAADYFTVRVPGYRILFYSTVPEILFRVNPYRYVFPSEHQRRNVRLTLGRPTDSTL